MNKEINYDQIEDKALDVLEASGIAKPVVNAVAIADKNGIQVKEIEMPTSYDDVAGFYNEKEKTIYVAKDDKSTRKLFTVAHELGHIFLGHKNYSVLLRIPKEDTLYSKEEKEANAFAAHLLMPSFLLKEYLEKYHLGRSNYREMAELFGVPLTAMKVQLEYLR